MESDPYVRAPLRARARAMPQPPGTQTHTIKLQPAPPQNGGSSTPAPSTTAAFPGGRRGAIAALGAGGLLLLLHAGVALTGGSSALASGLLLLLGGGIVAAITARAASAETERDVWLPASIAFAAWFLGTAYYSGSGRTVGSLSSFLIGDLVLLCFGGAAALAAGRLVKARVEQFQPTIVLDGVITAIAAAALGAALMSASLDRLTVEAHPGVLKLAYPIGGLLFLAFAIWVVALAGWRPDRLWSMLVGGLGLLTLASTAFVFAAARGTYEAGGPLDTVWLAGALALAIAAWQPREEPIQVKVDLLRRIVTTSCAAFAALALLVLANFTNVSTISVFFAAAAVAAVIARAGVSFKENIQLFADARVEAQTDALTSLGNRRKLMSDLRRELELASVESPRVLVMFDLDGFKGYNDTYGHPAGDALLMRLGANLGRVIRPYGNAYRLGGDEFCVLVVTGASSAKTIIALAAAALSEQGEGFTVRSSHGAVMLPHEARDATRALRVADQRMYAQKEDRRSSATRQARDILLQVLHEREPDLGDHLKGVAKLALAVATRLELGPEELDEVVRAAELHDVGKMAIPDEILRKPGPLTEEEWSFVRQHTIIGERILSAAPALLPVAKLVRSSHEHYDGAGYPDGLAGDAIPLGARIIAVCDAFLAMTSSRPYRPAIPAEDALAELQARSGTQFDPSVAAAFSEEIASLAPRYGGDRRQGSRAAARPAA
jgi:two-component system, cell cycle response regulator